MTGMRFLTPADIAGRPQDKRCILCLERAYIFWLEPEEPAGCPFGHSSKESCTEQAVPAAKNRAAFDELRRKGLIK